MTGGPLVVRVHPVSMQAAPIEIPADPLQAKFSIPYTAAFTLLHGPPGVADFGSLDPEACRLAAAVEVRTDERLGESAAVLEAEGVEPILVEAAVGSPQRPMDDRAIARKAASLVGKPLGGALDEHAGAADLLATIEGIDGTGSQAGSNRAQ